MFILWQFHNLINYETAENAECKAAKEQLIYAAYKTKVYIKGETVPFAYDDLYLSGDNKAGEIYEYNEKELIRIIQYI